LRHPKVIPCFPFRNHFLLTRLVYQDILLDIDGGFYE
jgi:hypothetical protein